jgi:mannosyltransferase
MNLQNLFSSVPRPSKTVVLLLFLIAIGSFLRIYKLELQSLWTDEINTMIESDPANSIQKVLLQLRRGIDPHPPLYFLLVHFWFQLVGYSAFTARLFSGVVGIVAIPAMYVLGKELYNRRVGLIAAAFTTFNFYNIFYSQEARGYILAFLLTCISFTFFIRALRNPYWKTGLWYGIATSFLMYTHYYGFFIVLSQVAILLIFLNRNTLGRFFICFGVAFSLMVILYLPWLGPVFTLTNRKSIWIAKPKANFFVTYFWDYFGKDAFTVFAFAFLLILFFLAGILLKRNEEDSSDIRENRYVFSFVILLTWIVVSYMVPFVKSLISLPVLFNRYTIVTLPAILLAAAIGLDLLFHSFLKKYIVVLIVLFSLIHLFATERYYEKPTRTQWREMIGFVVKNNPQNFPIISDRTFHMTYYFKLLNSTPKYVSEKAIPELTDVWIVTGNQGKPLSKQGQELLKNDFRLKLEFNGIGTWARYYSKVK